MAKTGAAAEVGSPTRHFLGWSGPLLDAAAEWLCRERGGELGELFVALPASRAGRQLEALLARSLGPAARPPRVLTVGALTDELLRVEGVVASRTARTVAWRRALEELPERELARLVPRAPEAEDFQGWTRLAESVRTLFGELAADGLRFDDVPPRLAAQPTERERWSALASAQARMEALLAEAGLVDPHLARLDALDRDAAVRGREVVLVGVTDLNGLQRRVLEQLGGDVTALVLAPEDLARGFDALGCLDVETWAARDLPLPLERWQVVDRPEDQARAAVRALAAAPRPYAPHEITIGLARTESAPYLQRRFAQSGVALRDAAGTPLDLTAPVRLLAAAARALDGWRAVDHAELLRHPDLERALRDAASGELLADLDAYVREHVPARVDGEWLRAKRDGGRRERLTAWHARLRELLGELTSDAARPLSAWAAPAREFLAAVYEAVEPDHELAGSLSKLGEALAELESLPPALAPPCRASAALGFLARALRGQRVPPPAADPDRPTVEMLGWLELLLDPAPALVVTGFEGGAIPEAVHGDAFLPDGLRRELGLTDNARRCARDAYALEAMLNSREHATLVTGRRSATNDPLAPSRLAFHCPPEEVVTRVRHALRADAAHARPTGAPAPSPKRQLPRREPALAPDTWRVTAFGDYLRSPYLYYLRHVLRVGTVPEDARELDGGVFGDLAHDVLQAFGESELRDSTDPERIAAMLQAELAKQARARVGDAPAPAVALQLEQLGWRLRHFAERQARRAAEGWRLVHSEWQPTREVRLSVDDQPVRLTGRIDRIDHHPRHGWAILDYKTGDAAKLDPLKSHRTRDPDQPWRDLQLPLYCLLTAELEMGEVPAVGYAQLGKDEGNIGFALMRGWCEEWLEDAGETAAEVVRKVRRGELYEVGRPLATEPVLLGLLGEGLLEPDADEDDDGEGAA